MVDAVFVLMSVHGGWTGVNDECLLGRHFGAEEIGLARHGAYVISNLPVTFLNAILHNFMATLF